MIHSALFKKAFLPAFCLFLYFNHTLAQEVPSSSSLDFSHEIGLDFAPFLRGQQGLSLLYKHKIGRKKVKKWQKKSALRLVAGFYKEEIGSYDLRYQRGDTTFARNTSTYDASRYFVNIGFERQLERNKFRVYYGGEVGYRGSRGQPESRTEATVNGTIFPYDLTQSKLTANGPEISAFGGANYFFLPRFSIGLELHLSYGVEFTTIDTFRNSAMVRSYRNTIFVGGTSLLHLLYVSYHF